MPGHEVVSPREIGLRATESFNLLCQLVFVGSNPLPEFLDLSHFLGEPFSGICFICFKSVSLGNPLRKSGNGAHELSGALQLHAVKAIESTDALLLAQPQPRLLFCKGFIKPRRERPC